MSNETFSDHSSTDLIFADPVTYLAGLGIEAELVDEKLMPAAA